MSLDPTVDPEPIQDVPDGEPERAHEDEHGLEDVPPPTEPPDTRGGA